MLKVFIGYDPAQAVAFNVCQFSIIRRASVPVSIIPLNLDALPIKRRGLTTFTFSRFLVPWVEDYEGWALFMDSDFLVLGDVAELFNIPSEDKYAVHVSKNPRRFEWPSLIMFKCDIPSNRILTPGYVEKADGLHHLSWLKEEEIGDLPREWNHLIGYDQPRTDAKAVHFTQGLPIFEETAGSEYAEQWKAEHKAMNSTEPWQVTMGPSVHSAMTKDGRRVAKLHKDAIRGD